MESSLYVKHDSQNCECCLDFWGAPEPQAPTKESVESDADSGYCSITRKDALTPYPPESLPAFITVPRIIVTPLSDDEQIEHNACIRASLLQRNAFTSPYITTTAPSTTSLAEEKALPSRLSTTADGARSTASLPISSTTSSRPSLRPPEESWSHRLKDTYENRITYPQYFNISPASTSTPTLRKRASKDIELHPTALPTTRQSIRKRWSISGSGVGFGCGKDSGTNGSGSGSGEAESARMVKTTSRRISSESIPSTPLARISPTPATTPATAAESTPLKRRARVTSTRSLSEKSSSFSPSPPNSRPTSMILTTSSGNALGRWANSASNAASGGGAFGKSMQGVKSFIGRYSGAPSSFRML